MKQILMSKEEYDQLLLDMENLKKEKEQLNEHNAELNKEVDRLEKMIEKGKGNEFMYLNQITTRYASFDIKLFVDKLNREVINSFGQYEMKTGRFCIKSPAIDIIKSIDETFIKGCLKTETEETEYDFCVTEQLLYGTLLQKKISDVSKLDWEIFQLKQKINEISDERDKFKNEFYNKEREIIGLRYDLTRDRKELKIVNEQCEKYRKEAENLSRQVKSLSDKIYFYKKYYIRIPVWMKATIETLKEKIK